jgi:hypothetical protein
LARRLNRRGFEYLTASALTFVAVSSSQAELVLVIFFVSHLQKQLLSIVQQLYCNTQNHAFSLHFIAFQSTVLFSNAETKNPPNSRVFEKKT